MSAAAAASTSIKRSSDVSSAGLRPHLPRELQFFIRDPVDSIITSDYDYYRRAVAVEMARFAAASTRFLADDSVFDYVTALGERMLFAAPDSGVVVIAHMVSDAFLRLAEELDAKLRKQLAASATLPTGSFIPTVERILAKMGAAPHNATDREQRIFRFLAMYSVGPFDLLPAAEKLINTDGYGRSRARFQCMRTVDRYREPPSALFASPSFLSYLFTLQPTTAAATPDLQREADYSLPFVLSMFTKTSPWVKARLLPALSGHPDDNATSQSTEATRLVLMGMAPMLTPTTYHTIDSIIVTEALSMNPQFMASEAGKAHSLALASREKESAATAAGEGGAVSLNPICEALRKRDRNAKDSVYNVMSMLAGGGVGGGVDGEAGNDSEEGGMLGARSASVVGLDRQDSAGATGGAMKKSKSAAIMEVEEGAVDLNLSPDKNTSNDNDDTNASPTNDNNNNNNGDDDDDDEDQKMKQPFENDLDYLQEMFRVLVLTKNVVTLEVKLEQSKLSSAGVVQVEDEDEPSWRRNGRGATTGNESVKIEGDLRKARGRLAMRQQVVKSRLRLTSLAGTWYPRLEILSEALKLTRFEKSVVLQLVKNIISPEREGPYGRSCGGARKTIGDLQESFCATLPERMSTRQSFYKSGALIMGGIVFISEDSEFQSDLAEATVVIDKRMVDLLCGMETEFSELCSASHLYTPTTSMDDVILPEKDKTKIINTVLAFEKVRRLTAQAYDGNNNIKGGTSLLFYGASGTGKTMVSNAIATLLKRKILLVNFPNLGSNSAGTIIRFLFREARINKALLFFDECESLFLSREKTGSFHVNTVLTEMERFDGMCILATNLPNIIDEAMRRRLHLAIEFRKPDHLMREKIWKTLRPKEDVVGLEDDVNFAELGLRFELTGGLIANAWRGAISAMVTRKANKINQSDIIVACAEQIKGRLSVSEFENKLTPTAGLDVLVVEDDVREGLQQVLAFTKAQSVLVSQWGFKERFSVSKGIAVLLCGEPGTGKTQAASCLAFELGRPIKVVSVAQILSKWVGESEKNLVCTFAEARAEDAILVIDEAESLFSTRTADSSSHDTSNTGVLLQLVEQHEGIVLVITNLRSRIDPAFIRRFRFILEFKKPQVGMRRKLWEKSIPPECPVAADVDYGRLATGYELTGAEIKQTILRAATRAALRLDAEKRKLFMADLERSAKEEEEKKKEGGSEATRGMYM